ncbi:unnamed protein product [Danaus chrysippus]|uniref:(African queen) hypothetical protein n=1 Tax=Danaus chrysippus TaxID=151541 RepID=A0A8J2QDE2_9NEOP|nr:unnamed protein product [Danaus chrysippus]
MADKIPGPPPLPILGNALKFMVHNKGAVWRKHRKIATPNFGKQATGSYFNVFNMEADILLEKLKEIRFGEEVDVYQYIVQSTSYSVCRKIYTIIFERMTKWFMQIEPVFWLTKSYQVEKEFVSRTDELCSAVIKLRINKLADIDEDKLKLLDTEKDSFNNTELSVVDRFILSRELDATDLKYEIFTIFTASQEATAKLAASLLLMLAFHPQCQKKAYDEITSVLRNKNKPISEEDLKQMPYLEMIFKEVLRLFPTGVVLQRKINEDITISSCTLPAGSSLVIPLYHMHRDSRFWENPESFDPERFSTENMKKRNAYCYFPFSLGPMDCLGLCLNEA